MDTLLTYEKAQDILTKYGDQAVFAESNGVGTVSTHNAATQGEEWVNTVVTLALKNAVYASLFNPVVLGKGDKTAHIPVEKKVYGIDDYGSTAITPGQEAYDITNVAFDALTTLDLTPQLYPAEGGAGVKFEESSALINRVDYIALQNRSIINHVSQLWDTVARDAIFNATAATSTAAGKQTIYGGTATDYDTLTAGDTLTAKLIRQGKQRLRSGKCAYTAQGGTGTAFSSEDKPPWKVTPGDTVLVVGTDSLSALEIEDNNEFVTYDKRGDNDVQTWGIETVGHIAGIEIMVSDNAPKATNTGGVEYEKCVLVNKSSLGAIAFGYNQRLVVVKGKAGNNLFCDYIQWRTMFAADTYDAATGAEHYASSIVEIAVATQ